MFCTKCGTQLENDVAFCHNCGNPVAKGNAQANSGAHAEFTGSADPQQFVDDDVCALIGEENKSYYIAKFADMKQKNKKATWNWPAFLVTPAWLVYRKMYAYGAIVWAVNMLLEEIWSFGGFVLSILFGVFANYIYMTHLEKLALQAKSLQEPEKSQFIEKNKGMSWPAVGFGVLAVFVITLVFGLIFAV